MPTAHPSAHPSATFLTHLPCRGSCSEVWQAASFPQLVNVPHYAGHWYKRWLLLFNVYLLICDMLALHLSIGSKSRIKPVATPGKHSNKERVGSMPGRLFVHVTGLLAQHVLTQQKATQTQERECHRLQVLVCKLWAHLWLNCFLTLIRYVDVNAAGTRPKGAELCCCWWSWEVKWKKFFVTAWRSQACVLPSRGFLSY